MVMYKLLHHSPIFLLGFALVACSKFSSKPIIKVSNPIQHTHFDAGQSIDMKAKFTDNKGLASFHFCVSDAAGNTHNAFNTSEEGVLSGKDFTLNRTIHTPAAAEGTYYLHFIVVDSDGKENETFHEFHIDQ
jgi:hypothetical protein